MPVSSVSHSSKDSFCVFISSGTAQVGGLRNKQTERNKHRSGTAGTGIDISASTPLLTPTSEKGSSRVGPTSRRRATGVNWDLAFGRPALTLLRLFSVCLSVGPSAGVHNCTPSSVSL